MLQQPDQTAFTGLRDYTILLLFLDTGIRIGELLALHVEDVNLREKELRIRHGKGDKELAWNQNIQTNQTINPSIFSNTPEINKKISHPKGMEL